MSNLQTILNFMGGIIMGGFAWFITMMWNRIDSVRSELAQHKAETPKDYVSKEDYRNDMSYIKSALDEILRTLGTKADRT